MSSCAHPLLQRSVWCSLGSRKVWLDDRTWSVRRLQTYKRTHRCRRYYLFGNEIYTICVAVKVAESETAHVPSCALRKEKTCEWTHSAKVVCCTRPETSLPGVHLLRGFLHARQQRIMDLTRCQLLGATHVVVQQSTRGVDGGNQLGGLPHLQFPSLLHVL